MTEAEFNTERARLIVENTLKGTPIDTKYLPAGIQDQGRERFIDGVVGVVEFAFGQAGGRLNHIDTVALIHGQVSEDGSQKDLGAFGTINELSTWLRAEHGAPRMIRKAVTSLAITATTLYASNKFNDPLEWAKAQRAVSRSSHYDRNPRPGLTRRAPRGAGASIKGNSLYSRR